MQTLTGPGFLLAVLFAATVAQGQQPAAPPPGQVVQSAETKQAPPPDALPATPVTDAERSAIAITALTLNLHLTPATAHEQVRATLILRNTSSEPVARIPLQLSSTLHWLTASAATPAGLRAIPFTQSPIATDADHTGYAREAVFTPAAPLASGASLTLALFYEGDIPQSSDRLELLGAPHDQAAATDWDAIAPTSDAASTALRGFGNVLWYPVAAPVALLGNGNQLFDLVARERRRNAAVTLALRLTVEYAGDPPDSAILDGQLQPLLHAPDTDTQLVGDTNGIATAEWPATPIGYRIPSLFLTAQHAVTTPAQSLTVITPGSAGIAPAAKAAGLLQPLLSDWLGETPRSPLLLLDHPGQPFEDAGFLAAQLGTAGNAETLAPNLVRGLAHAWWRPQTKSPAPASEWLDQGVAEFMSILWTEHTQGREAALGALRHASVLIALAEPDAASSIPRQPLTEAYSEVFLHLKSAFVLWQLRELVGEDVLRHALTAYRRSLAANPAFEREPSALSKMLEEASKKDLAWFFDDWVYRDRGLPDLTIVSANPRAMPARAGKSSGYLVAVEVRNDGDAACEVPVTVRSGTLTSTERLRIAAHASASTRILFESNPETLQVNDGSVPELRTTTHTLNFAPQP